MITRYPTVRERWEHRPTGEVNPFELFMLVACVATGSSTLAGVAAPGSITATLPHSFVIAWAILLTVGSVLSLTGLFWPGHPATGPEIKRVGLVSTGFATAAYAVAAANAVPTGAGIGSASLNIAFTTACLYRTIQVTRLVRGTRVHLAAIRDHH